MALYRITFDVYNTRKPEFPSQRVKLDVRGFTARDARDRVRTIYVSEDGAMVNTTGKVFNTVGRVGEPGYWYPEWKLVSQRKIGA